MLQVEKVWAQLTNLCDQLSHHNVVSALCEGSETLTECKSESVMDKPTNGLTGVGARDACGSKNVVDERNYKVMQSLIMSQPSVFLSP